MKTILMTILIIASTAMPAPEPENLDKFPVFLNGKQLRGYCVAADNHGHLSFCNGYIAGVLDQLSAHEKNPCYDTTGHSVREQVTIVREFLNTYPGILKYPAANLIEQATVMDICW